MSKLWQNMTVHNLVGHPLSELVWLVTRRRDWSRWIHDVTLPPEDAPVD